MGCQGRLATVRNPDLSRVGLESKFHSLYIQVQDSPQESSSESMFGNSRITFHHFIIRELFLVIISSWLTSKNSGRIFLVICRICISCLTSSLQATYVIITSENWGINFRKDLMGITSKYSRGINYVILAFRMVCLRFRQARTGHKDQGPLNGGVSNGGVSFEERHARGLFK